MTEMTKVLIGKIPALYFSKWWAVPVLAVSTDFASSKMFEKCGTTANRTAASQLSGELPLAWQESSQKVV